MSVDAVADAAAAGALGLLRTLPSSSSSSAAATPSATILDSYDAINQAAKVWRLQCEASA